MISCGYMTVYAALGHTYWIPKVDDEDKMNGVYPHISFITESCVGHFSKSSVVLFAGLCIGGLFQSSNSIVARTHWQKLLSTFKSMASSKVLTQKASSLADTMHKILAYACESEPDLTEVKGLLQSVSVAPSIMADLAKLPGGAGPAEKLQNLEQMFARMTPFWLRWEISLKQLIN